MSESINRVGESFPQTADKPASDANHLTREEKRQEVARAERFAQYLVECVCVQMNITAVAFHSGRRDRKISRPRQIACWLLRNHPSAKFSYPVIGIVLKRDHTSIMYGVNAVHFRIVNGAGSGEDQKLAQRLCNMMALHGFKPFDVRTAR